MSRALRVSLPGSIAPSKCLSDMGIGFALACAILGASNFFAAGRRVKFLPAYRTNFFIFPSFSLPAGSICPLAAARGGINQHIVGLRLHTALNHSLQIFILYLKFLKGQVVHINNKAVIPVFNP